MGSTDGIGKIETTLAQGLAEHYLPSRQEIKIETEEERKLRAHRVRLENRERKKRWREQNNERSITPREKQLTQKDKDNDLRCRVNKRANSIFGPHASPDKNAFIEAEFAKRQQKRRGKAPSPSAEGSDGTDNMYATILNNPEFANILMNLLAQKGLDPNDTESSAQLLELLKSNPEFLRGFLTAPTEENMEQPIKNDTMEMPQLMDHIGMDTHLGLPTALQFETLSMETSLAPEVSPIVAPMAPQRPAPIPCLGTRIEEEIVPPRPSIPMPAPNPVPSLPMYIPPTVPLSIQQPTTSHNRVQAFGFPPMMSQSR